MSLSREQTKLLRDYRCAEVVAAGLREQQRWEPLDAEDLDRLKCAEETLVFIIKLLWGEESEYAISP